MAGSDHSSLRLRLVSAAVLVPATLGAVWAGGIMFAMLTGLIAVIVVIEWARLVGAGPRRAGYWVGAVGVVAAIVTWIVAAPVSSLAVLAVAIGLAAVAAAARGGSVVWTILGVSYAGLPAVALLLLRGDGDAGLAALFWLLALVWAADTAAFAVGRTVNGPRLAPRISPNKTWAGAIAAIVAAAMVGLATAVVLGDTSSIGLGLASVVIGGAAVAGDLAESAVKRRFNVKDTGTLIPGHGGMMDRVDSLAAAAIAAMILGVARGGVTAPAEGVLGW